MKVYRCVRPQCRTFYPIDTKDKYCRCGAELKIFEQERDNTSSNNKMRNAFLSIVSKDNEKEGSITGSEKRFPIGNKVKIGRATKDIKVDLDLTEYGDKTISREHAIIERENGMFFITNLSNKNYVKLFGPNNEVITLDNGSRGLLESGMVISLSKRILLLFEEE